MNHLNYEIEYLKESFIELLELARTQLVKSVNALINNDASFAEEVIRTEKRVNALELSIEKSCETIIALFQPVATDLRLVLAIFKSVSDVERIGDHADFISKIARDRHENVINKIIFEKYAVYTIFKLVDEMHVDIVTAFETKNTELARNTFRKDKEINKIYRELIKTMKTDSAELIADLLDIYSVVARIERSSNLLTNIAEEIIFYIDAEIFKHKKKKKLKIDQKAEQIITADNTENDEDE